MPDTAATDHELILLIRQDQAYTNQQIGKLINEIERHNARFEAIALNEQKTDLAVSALRQDFSRAMLEAADAKIIAAGVRSDLSTWQTRIKTAAMIGGPFAVIMAGVAQEFIKRWLFP